MKTTPLALLLVAAVIGSMSAAVTTLLLLPDDEGGETTQAPAPATRPAVDVLARLDALSEENRLLRERVVDLELRPTALTSAAPLGGYASQDDLDAFMKDVQQSMAKLDERTPEPTVFKDQVADVLQEVRKDEAVAKVRDGHEKRSGQLEERVTGMVDWLELDAYQANELRAILVAKDEREREIIRLWDAGTDESRLGELKQENRLALFAGLEHTLSTEQMATFTEKFGNADGSNGGKGQD